MSAIELTKSLERKDVPIDCLIPNPNNPNKMPPRAFDLLVNNILEVGLTEPILVVQANPEGTQFRIVGGHHRWEAAKYLQFDDVPVTIIKDGNFNEEKEQLQIVRQNVIRGKMDASKFMQMYQNIAGKYDNDEILLQEMFGFSDDAEFQKLIEQTKKSLPSEMHEAFDKAKGEIKTIDGLSKVLNHLFATYGDTLPYGYMVLDYGGQDSVWLRVSKKTMKATRLLGDVCVNRKRTMDDLVGILVQKLAAGELPDLLEELVKDSKETDIPASMQALPTQDNLDTITQL